MPTSKLRLTATELLKMANLSGKSNIFPVGEGPGKISEADLIEMLEFEEQAILSQLPEIYREIISGKVVGEYLTSKQMGAKQGQTTVTLTFGAPVEGTLLLFKNYDSLGKPWKSRTRSDAMIDSAYTVNSTTGVITFYTALTAGDSIIACYEHTAGQLFTSVRQLVLKAGRLELMTRMENWSGSEQAMVNLREWIDEQIAAYHNGGTPKGIGIIDDIEFYQETRPNFSNGIKLPFMGGRG